MTERAAGGNMNFSVASPAMKAVDRLLFDALEARASDIHLSPKKNQLVVRLRIDGELDFWPEPLTADLVEPITNRIKILARLNTAEHRQPQDGRFSYDWCGRSVDVRVSTMPVFGGEKIVLRLLNAVEHLSVSELDFSREQENVFRRWCALSKGLLLTTGPVGSGKTTTLYAALGLMDTVHRNVITIEDPIECIIDGVSQTAADERRLTFARCLRAALRQDFDTAVVGEIRDAETAEVAVRAALTGRLILSTLHTADAIGAIIRLFEMGVTPYLLAATLAGTMAQRLVRRLCPHCREKYIVGADSAEAAYLGEAWQENMVLYRPAGCPHCRNTGFVGRLAIREMLPVGKNISAAISRQAERRELEEIAKAQGFRPMKADGIAKAIGGKTALSEIMRSLAELEE